MDIKLEKDEDGRPLNPNVHKEALDFFIYLG